MGRFAKKIKKYERHLLLALVVILLLTFSVGGAISCQDQGRETKVDYAGNFLVSPAEREGLDNSEVVSWLNRYGEFLRGAGTPTLAHGDVFRRIRSDSRRDRAMWSHALPTSAARAVGYTCGADYQFKAAVAKTVAGVLGGMPFSDDNYLRFLRDNRIRRNSFETSVREVVIKDLFIQPLVETQRLGVSYEEAYEIWSRLLAQVDLEYVCLTGEDFELAARRQEETRTRIATQIKTLADVGTTASAIDKLHARLEVEHEKPEGAWPEDLTKLMGSVQKDAWDRELRYTVDGDTMDLRSAGPDGGFDSSDDVTFETKAQIRTRVALREVGDALMRWHAAKDAWPENLDAMRASPGEGLLPPLKSPAVDGWAKELVYTPAREEEGAAPSLFSAGVDGEAGTDDDVLAVVSEDGTLVPPGIAFIPYLTEESDFWERPIRIEFARVLHPHWSVVSAGPDGAWDTDDDLARGNQAELEAFYQSPEIQAEFEVPSSKEFETLFVHLPLVSDEVLIRLLKAYPQHKVDEVEAFDHWRGLHGYSTRYGADDPKDPKTGHGAEFLEGFDLKRDVALVPGSTVFGDNPGNFYSEDDPDGKAYAEDGWRSIVLREMFLERLMNDLLTRARDSRVVALDWDARKKAQEEAAGAGDGADGNAEEDLGERPAEVTFEDLLAGELAAFQPAEDDIGWILHFRSTEPMSRVELEGIPHLGSIELNQALLRIGEDGDYAAGPTILNNSHTKAIVRLLKDHPRHVPDLAEVREEVFERYLIGRRLDLATERLVALQGAVAEAAKPPEPEAAIDEPDEGEEEGEDGAGEADVPADEKDPAEIWKTALEAWAEGSDAPHKIERTGVFIGARPPRAHDFDEVGLEETTPEVARLRRLDFLRTMGYETLRSGVPVGDELTVGMLGQNVLRDDASDGTDSVYLVRLAEISYPPKEAFSPRDYADYLSTEAYGGPRGGRRIGAVAGSEQARGVVYEALFNFYFWQKFDWLMDKFDLRTEIDLLADPDQR